MSRIRSAVTALGCFLIILITVHLIEVYNEYGRMKTKLATPVVDSLQFIEKTLEVAYGLSEPEQVMYAELFKRYAGKEWPLVAATIQIESKFNPTLTSPAKAKGLMQLLEGTFQDQCNKLKIPYKENVSIWNESINVRCGIAFLFEDTAGGTTAMVKRYIGGVTYVKAEKGGVREKTINDYYDAVMREYVKLQYIYKGVLK